MLEELKTITGDVRVVDPTGKDASWLRAQIEEVNPEILVGAWMLPKLPVDKVGRDGVKYLCYLAGSVKNQVTEDHLNNGLLVTNWGNSISRVVAECGLMLCTMALRRATYWALEMHNKGAWKHRETEFYSLFERKVGIHGFGAISRELVRLMAPWNCDISTFSPSVPDSLLEEYAVKRVHTLEELFSQNDVIIELAALKPDTRGIVDERLLRMIPEGGVFVNIGRGAVVDEEALARIAAEGKLQVALDVYGTEPLPADSPFRRLSNVTLLPHLGGPTTERRRDSGRLALENIKAFYDNAELDAVIDIRTYSRIT